MEEYRVLVCGDRNWGSYEENGIIYIDEEEVYAIEREIKRYHKVFGSRLVIIHGNARGADKIAGGIANQLGITTRPYPAPWRCLDDQCKSVGPDGVVRHRDVHGKAAGPYRNRKMLREEDPHTVLAFHKNLSLSKGTKDMVNVSEKAGKEVFIFKE